jgi:hypothetical protein
VKVFSAPNSAIGLAVACWLLAVYGVLRQLGDAAPWVSKAELELHRQISSALAFTGVLALLASLWISGYCFSRARKRAFLTVALVVTPLVFLFAQFMRVHAA